MEAATCYFHQLFIIVPVDDGNGQVWAAGGAVP